IRKPIGVVGLITPWNFPSAIPAWKLAPALICGNTVVLKPASAAPLSAWRIVEALHEAGAPKGVVNFVAGAGGELGQALVDAKPLRGISFTGSCQIGNWQDPVKEIPRSGLASTSACPSSPPAPATKLTTPFGAPASCSASTIRHALRGAAEAGLSTTVLPQISAGASFHAGIALGKFHGVIRPTTPIGLRM